jgi:hypothetical protein
MVTSSSSHVVVRTPSDSKTMTFLSMDGRTNVSNPGHIF